jgi:hypothetical protein
MAATIVITTISFGSRPAHDQTVTIKYRKTSDPDVSGSYTTVATGLVLPVPPTGNAVTLSPEIDITGLDEGTAYTIIVINECSDRGVSKTITTAITTTYTWLEDTFVCEQDSAFTETSEVTGLSSPQRVMYDATSALVYGYDSDSTSGNFFSYDPTAFTLASDVTYYPPILQGGATKYMFAGVVDPTYRKIYIMGRDSDGVQVLDIATNTVSVIVFGLNANVPPSMVGSGFNRLLMRMVGTQIYATDVYSAKLLTIDRATGTHSERLLSTITDGDSLKGAAEMHSVNGEIWIVESQSGVNNANIMRYDTTFTKIGEIDITALSATWSNSHYWRNAFYDVDNDTYYVHDSGTNTLIMVNGTTHTITTKVLDVRQGKSNSSFGFIQDPITQELYMSGQYLNSTSDVSPINITYKIDRVTKDFVNVYDNTTFGNLARIDGQNELHGTFPGALAWNGGTAWSTDGKIIKFSK